MPAVTGAVATLRLVKDFAGRLPDIHHRHRSLQFHTALVVRASWSVHRGTDRTGGPRSGDLERQAAVAPKSGHGPVNRRRITATSRRLLQQLAHPRGSDHDAVDGVQAVFASAGNRE